MARTLRFALEGYDRHVPFFLGTVEPPPGIRFQMLEVSGSPAGPEHGDIPAGRDGANLHWRMLHTQDFDIAEFSLSSYAKAVSLGAALTAVPVFPRRLFSQNHIFVRTGAGIRKPADLEGRRVILRSFQTSLSVLAKGDLKSVYGVDWRRIHWITLSAEPSAWTAPAGVTVEKLPAGATVDDFFLEGGADALIDPRPSSRVLAATDSVANLFGDSRTAITGYFQQRGFFPIMHVLALRPSLTREFPQLPAYLLQAWDLALRETQEKYEDYNYTLLPFGRQAYVDTQAAFGPNLWRNGLRANQANLEQFIGYLAEQTIIARPFDVRDLFHPSTLDS